MIHKIKTSFVVFFFYFFRVFPINDRKIVINMYDGKGYGDNGKYIVDTLLNRDVEYDIVWLSRNKHDTFPKGVRRVPYFSLKAIYEQATSKIWIGNKRKPGYVRKRKNQYYIMTWHAGITLKRVEADAGNALTNNYISAAKRDSQMANLFLSSSDWDTSLYRKAFWYDGEILECGYPRQDILFKASTIKSNNLKKTLGISGKKVLLYAPTFRKEMIFSSNETIDTSMYDLNWNAVLSALQKKLGGEWVGLIRLHPNVTRFANKLKIPSDVINVSNYNDMQELLLMSDCLITDYSSSVFDYAITFRPAFIYATDFDDYKKDRDFYFDLNKLPFPFSKSGSELERCIDQFQYNSYQKELNDFLYKECGLKRGGCAAEAVCDRIEKITNI